MNDENIAVELREVTQVMNYIAKALKSIESELKNVSRAVGRIR